MPLDWLEASAAAGSGKGAAAGAATGATGALGESELLAADATSCDTCDSELSGAGVGEDFFLKKLNIMLGLPIECGASIALSLKSACAARHGWVLPMAP